MGFWRGRRGGCVRARRMGEEREGRSGGGWGVGLGSRRLVLGFESWICWRNGGNVSVAYGVLEWERRSRQDS